MAEGKGRRMGMNEKDAPNGASSLDDWVAAHLDRPETIWQAFRDYPETEAPPEELSEEDAEAEEAELAALLGYAEQMSAMRAFGGGDAFPPPMGMGMDDAFPLPPDLVGMFDDEEEE